MLRVLSIPVLLLTLPGCFLFDGGRDAEAGDSGSFGGESLFLRDCDISCRDDGLDLEVEAFGADSAEVEFYVSATLVETFVLTQLDDETFVGYPDWPAGYSFSDCGAEADFVCVVRGGGEEVRESR